MSSKITHDCHLYSAVSVCMLAWSISCWAFFQIFEYVAVQFPAHAFTCRARSINCRYKTIIMKKHQKSCIGFKKYKRGVAKWSSHVFFVHFWRLMGVHPAEAALKKLQCPWFTGMLVFSLQVRWWRFFDFVANLHLLSGCSQAMNERVQR